MPGPLDGATPTRAKKLMAQTIGYVALVVLCGVQAAQSQAVGVTDRLRHGTAAHSSPARFLASLATSSHTKKPGPSTARPACRARLPLRLCAAVVRFPTRIPSFSRCSIVRDLSLQETN